MLPQSLRELWRQETLPAWVAKDLLLPEGATYSALGAGALSTAPMTERLKNFLLQVMRSRRRQIGALRVFPRRIPLALTLTKLPFSVRTRNCLTKYEVLADRPSWERKTYGDLLETPAMGVASVLDLACVIEAATDKLAAVESAEVSISDSELEQISKELVDAIDSPWASQISAQDPRFRDAFPPGEGTISDRIDFITSQPQEDRGIERALAEALKHIRHQAGALKALTLERQLRDFLQALRPRFNHGKIDALVMRLGFSGQPPVTLEDAAASLGVTRERLRQLQKALEENLPEHPVFMPALDEAIEAIRVKAPLELNAASKLLRDLRLTSVPFDPRSVLRAAEFCRRPAPFQILSYGGREQVVLEPTEGASVLLGIARKQAGASGCSNVKEVIAEAASRRATVPPEHKVIDLLRTHPDIEFLEGDWFWCTGTPIDRNRVRNVTRKMLSVTSPIHISSLREGIRRHVRYRKNRGVSGWPLVIPPRVVMRRFYEVHPEFAIDGAGQVATVEPLDHRRELGVTEQAFVDVLRSSPACILDRASCAKGCLERGINQHTFSTFLTYSPVLEHLGTDIWSLRGVRVDPTAVEAVRAANAARPREKRVLDHGWSESGNLWLAIRIPALYNSLIVGVPAVVRHMLANRRFTVTDEGGARYGAIWIDESGVSGGYGTFLLSRGADEDDILIAEFQLVSGNVVLRLGDDETLDELAPQA